MKFTLSWLKEYLDTNADLQTITDKLTAIGLEVESVQDRGKELAPFVIAYVESAEKHPNADRLKVCNVTDGKNKYQVVCGAPNAKTGMKGVLAVAGTYIPRDKYELKKGNIRGVESQGMLCSASELGMGEDADGIIELPADAPVGASYAKTYGIDDAIIEINLTPNRADCAGIYGIARDLAAAGIGKLKDVQAPAIQGKFKSTINVAIDSKDCPEFAGRLIKNVSNVYNLKNPKHADMKKKIESVGLRSISPLVDITNFFTIAGARPMHVFDADKVKGNLKITEAKGGEKLAALNDKEYTLQAGMTVVNDDSGTISLAGIVGGASTGVDEKTKNVFLEVALWNPARIMETGRKLEVMSDARYRFERGVDPSGVLPSVQMATQIILDLCGGEPSEIVVAGGEPNWKRTIEFKFSRVKKWGGVDIAAATAKDILQRLGFLVITEKKLPAHPELVEGSGTKDADKMLRQAQHEQDIVWTLSVPSWRGDVEGEADIVEEILRIHGYDNITPISLPNPNLLHQRILTAPQKRTTSARRILAARGLQESVNFSFVSSEQAKLFGGGAIELKLLNPISADLDMMRPSLLPSLLSIVKANEDRGTHDLGLFEVGPQYAGVKETDQVNVAAIVRAGHNLPHRSWNMAQEKSDAYIAKADVEALLSEFGVDTSRLQISTDAPGFYHPGQSAVLKQGPNILARFGVVHPKILKFYDIKAPVVAAEIFLAAVPLPKDKGTKARAPLMLSAFQAVERDFAFVVGNEVTAEAVRKAALEADKQIIVDAYIFDKYDKGDLAKDGKKSIAVAVRIQPADKTLTDAEIEAISQKIIQSVGKATGGVLRK